MTHLNLHLEMLFEASQQCNEDGQGELKNLRHRADTIFREGYTQILLDSIDEHGIGTKHWPCILQDGQQKLQ